MRVKGFWVILSVLVIMTSCSTTKRISKSDKGTNKELSESAKQNYYYAFLEANRKKLLGDINGALALYYKCLEINPKGAGAMSEISVLNEATKNYDIAIKYALKAVNTDGENKWYKINLAKLYIVTQDYQKAIDVYENLYSTNIDDLEIPYNMAALYTKIGNYKKAIELYNSIEEKTGVNENLSIAKQQLYVALGNNTKAYEEIQKLIKYYPNEPKYYGILAEMYTSDNLFLKAEENYKKLFKIDSTNKLGELSIIDFYRKKMDYDNAFKMINKVVNNPEIDFDQKVLIFANILNNKTEFNIYNEKIKELLLLFRKLNPDKEDDNTLYADYLIKMNMLDSAKTEIEFILNNYSGNAAIWEQLLSIYSYQGEFENLYEKSKVAIDSFPDHSLFYLFNGISASQLNKNEEAIGKFKKGLKLAEKDPKLELDFYTYLGDAYYKNKEYSQSDYYFEQVLKKQPDNLYVINNYSYYLSLREDKLEYAESISKKTIEAEPNNDTYLDTYAWILYKLKRYREALVYIQRAYENGGSESDVIVEHYGDIQFKLGEKEEALKLWKQSQEMGNSSEALIEKINKNK